MSMAPSIPRAPLGPLSTPPRHGSGSPASRHSRTPSEPSPLRNVSYSAADAHLEDASNSQAKVALRGRYDLDRPGNAAANPADIATLLGLKPTSLRSVSASSYDSDRTVRANNNGSSPLSSPRDSPRDRHRRSPRDSFHNSSRRGSRPRSPASSPRSPRHSTTSVDMNKENAENIPPPCYFSQPLHKRKLSESVRSPQNRKQAARRNVSSPAPTNTTTVPVLPHQPSVSTPGATFGTYPTYPLPPMPAWLQDPSVLDVLAQLADEAQDPASPSTSLASSTWAAILRPRDSQKVLRPLSISPKKDVFSSPRSPGSSVFEEQDYKYCSPPRNKESPVDDISPRTDISPRKDTNPRISKSPRTLKLMAGLSTPTIPEIDEEKGLDSKAPQNSTARQLSNMSPTKHARREATALASPAFGKSWAPDFASPTNATAQWIIATSHLRLQDLQVEPALSASMASLTLSTVPVDPEFAEGDVTLVCRDKEGHTGLKTDSKMLQTYL